jgi:diamine N-acetyltransferase
MLQIRRATLDDIETIRQLAEYVFPETYKSILTESQTKYMMEWMYSYSSLHVQMAEDGHMYYLAYDGEHAVGYVSIQPQGADIFHLQKIYVLPSCQGKGFGKQLFLKAVDIVKSFHPQGVCRMELNVNRHNKALTFYEKMGMYRVSQGDFDIGNGFYMNDYIMALDIFP